MGYARVICRVVRDNEAIYLAEKKTRVGNRDSERSFIADSYVMNGYERPSRLKYNSFLSEGQQGLAVKLPSINQEVWSWNPTAHCNLHYFHICNHIVV